MEPAPIAVAAERWSGSPGHLHAEGSVVATMGADAVTAQSADLDAEAHALILRDGTWTRANVGTLAFETLTLRWANGWSGEATGAAFRGAEGDPVLRVTGERLVWDGAGNLSGERVHVSPCDCETPPLGVQAKHVSVTPGEEATFRGGWLELAGLPIVPVPAGQIPLTRRSGLLPPVVGFGDDGLRLAAPVYLTLGAPADLTLTPELRTLRSARGLGALRYALPGGTGALSGSLGTDWQADAIRGAGEWAHRASRGSTGAAVQAQVLGDPGYLVDYADAYLARATPWVESRAWAGAGPVELFGSAFQLDERATDRAGAAVRWPGALPGGGVAELEAASVVTAEGASGVGAARLVRDTWAGPVRFRPELAGGAATSLALWGTGALEIALPLWRDTSVGRQTLTPSLRALAGVGARESLAAVPMGGLGAPPVSDDVPAWSLEPGLRWGAGSAGEVRVGAALRPDGVRGSATVSAAAHGLNGWGQVETGPEDPIPDLAAAGIRTQLGSIEAGASGLWTSRLVEPLASGSPTLAWVLPGPLTPVRLTAAGLFDLVTPAWQSATTGVRWTHARRCLAVEAMVRVDSDEPPAVRLGFDLAP